MTHADLLIEVGTEELPPKSLLKLSHAFREGLEGGLSEAGLDHGTITEFATPRRLALRVAGVALVGADEEIEKRGPAIKAAFDADGNPSRAGLAFAKSVGRDIDELERLETDKGAWLYHRSVVPGKSATDCLPAIVAHALDKLPIPKPMRWGAADHEFVRPAHWLVLMLDDAVVPATVLGLTSGRTTRGHRFHAPEPRELNAVSEYPATLANGGYVQADFAERRSQVQHQIAAVAEAKAAEPVMDSALLDEITALVEWPIAVAGSFDREYLALPEEVLIAALQDHQRFVPLRGEDGALTSEFVAISNVDSPTPEIIKAGYERVVRPRLADAAFFYGTDKKISLSDQRERLHSVLFQKKLGSLYEVSDRLANLAAHVATDLGYDVELARRAGELSRSDLVTDMVSEFPQLQGTMGAYYAAHDGEPQAVCQALEQQYWPRFAGDELPSNDIGQCLSLASKLDLVTGIFAIGQKPSGTRDPFGLRRAALGVLRIAIECELPLDVRKLIAFAGEQLPVDTNETTVDDVYAYLLDRLPAYYRENGSPFTTEMLNAVNANRPPSPLDFHRRLEALQTFMGNPEAESLAAANKRVANILRKADESSFGAVNQQLFEEAAEQALFETLKDLRKKVVPALDRRAYGEAMGVLAGTRSAIDRFFDDVMVMAEQENVRRNRLALLGQIRELYNGVADLSQLGG